MTHTKGNVIVENIKVGDIHYEFEYGIGIKTEVITLPMFEQQEDGKLWTWKSKRSDGSIINYAVHDKYSHYGPNLYDYEAYTGCKFV